MRKLVQLRAVPLDPTARRLGACYDISTCGGRPSGGSRGRCSTTWTGRPTRRSRSRRTWPRSARGGSCPGCSRGWRRRTRRPRCSARRCRCRCCSGRSGTRGCCTRTGRSARPARHARHGLPYTLSTMATTGIEELRAGSGRRRRAVVSAVPDQGPRAVVRTGGPGRGQRVHDARGHGGHDRGGQPGTGPAQRAVHSARADPGDGRLGGGEAVATGTGCCPGRRWTTPTSPGGRRRR